MRSGQNLFQNAAHKVAKHEPRQAAWWVYESYEVEVIKRQAIVFAPLPKPKTRKLPTRGDSPATEIWEPEDFDLGIAKTYAPLRDHPDLFLKFARLADRQPITVEVMLEWARNYGLLGAEDIDHVAYELAVGITVPSSGEGRRESLLHFTQAIWEAARCLRLYEALKAPGGPAVKTLTKMYQRGELMNPGELEEEAQSEVESRIARYLESETYLLPYRRDNGSYVEGPGFRSLLGAVWIQMWWLLKAGDNLNHCFRPDCYRIIDYDKPPTAYQGPTTMKKKTYKRGPYKTRIDKYFCHKRCYELWRYHEKNAGRSGRLADVLDYS